MTKKSKLTKAIALVITGTAISMAGVSNANATTTTMYNLYRANFGGYDANGFAIYTPTSTTPCAPCNNPYTTPVGPNNASGGGTDGWVWSANPQLGQVDPLPNPMSPVTPIGEGPGNAALDRPGWVGIGGSSTPNLITPFGYNSGGILHWAIEMTGGNGGSGEISNADSISRYSQSADIDTARGAWSDTAQAPNASGWKHDLDFGLFKSDTTGKVTLSIVGVNGDGVTKDFGFTIFQGMSTSTAGYNHHGGWNANQNTQPGAPTSASVPISSGFNLTAANIVAYSIGGASPVNLNTIQFDANAGQIYTIVLGGYKNGGWTDTTDGYKLTVSQAPVPIPAAVWLFVSALAGLGVFGRRNKQSGNS